MRKIAFLFRKHPLYLLPISLFLLAVWSLLVPLYYLAKAELAQVFLDQAWQEAKQNNTDQVKPWPWADTWPVLKMKLISSENKLIDEFIVLADASGQSLAFGPGLFTRNIEPGMQGNSIIAAHRDTHFSILNRIRIGDKIQIEDLDGNVNQFKIDGIKIVDSHHDKPKVNIFEHRVTLVTCYPFDMSVQNPNLRYVVSGVRLS